MRSFKRQSIPLFCIRLEFDGAFLQESSALGGVHRLAVRMLLEGTEKLPGPRFQTCLEALGVEYGMTSTGLHFQGMSSIQKELLGLLEDLLLSPALSQNRLSRLKWESREDLKALIEDNESLVQEILRQNIYTGTPLATNTIGSLKSLSRIGAKNIDQWRQDFLGTAGLRVYVAGDFDLSLLLSSMDRVAKKLHMGKSVPERFRIRFVQQKARLCVVRKRYQACIAMGHSGIERQHPDYLALRLADQVFGSGGGLHNRLARRLREELGLCYTVYGDITSTAYLSAGMMQMYTAVADRRVQEAIFELRSCLESFLQEGPSEQELSDARSHLQGSRLFLTESSAALCTLLREKHIFSLGPDFLETDAEKMQNTGPLEVKMACSRHYRPDDLSLVVASSKEQAGFTKIKPDSVIRGREEN